MILPFALSLHPFSAVRERMCPSGMSGLITVGFLKGKYKLVLFLPTYLLFYVLQIWGGSVLGEFSTSYFDYLMFYDGTLKNYAAFVVFLLSMLISSLTAVAVLSKRDICN